MKDKIDALQKRIKKIEKELGLNRSDVHQMASQLREEVVKKNRK